MLLLLLLPVPPTLLYTHAHMHALHNDNMQQLRSLAAMIFEGQSHKETVTSRTFSQPFGKGQPPQLQKSFVLPHVDYCSVVQQECTNELQQKVERIQKHRNDTCMVTATTDTKRWNEMCSQVDIHRETEIHFPFGMF